MVWIFYCWVLCWIVEFPFWIGERQTDKLANSTSKHRIVFLLIPIINWHRIVLRQCEAMFAWWTVFMAWTCLVPCLPTLSWLAQQLHAPTRKDWRLQMRHLVRRIVFTPWESRHYPTSTREWTFCSFFGVAHFGHLQRPILSLLQVSHRHQQHVTCTLCCFCFATHLDDFDGGP